MAMQQVDDESGEIVKKTLVIECLLHRAKAIISSAPRLSSEPHILFKPARTPRFKSINEFTICGAVGI